MFNTNGRETGREKNKERDLPSPQGLARAKAGRSELKPGPAGGIAVTLLPTTSAPVGGHIRRKLDSNPGTMKQDMSTNMCRSMNFLKNLHSEDN